MWQRFLKLDDSVPAVNVATSAASKDDQSLQDHVAANGVVASPNEATSRAQNSKRRATSTLADEPAPKRPPSAVLGGISGEDESGSDASLDADNHRTVAGQDSHGNLETDRPWATQQERDVIKRMVALPWRGCLALFGRPSDFENATDVEERRAILEAVKARERTHQTRHFDSWHRLDGVKQFTRWRNVGCQLCFASTGQPEPDHTFEDCIRWEGGQTARDICKWLEGLQIPRDSEGLGGCSLCFHTIEPCEAVRMACRASSASTDGSRSYWVQLLKSRDSQDGFCDNKPVLRKTIAALCTYDEQVLGKALAVMVANRDQVDFTAENQVAYWFAGKVAYQDGWIPRIFFVLEMLLWAWEFRQQRTPQRTSSDSKVTYAPSLTDGWDDADEILNWRTCLAWWTDKCGFCAGKGLGDDHIKHTLNACHRGGARQRLRGLGEQIYLEGLNAEEGCPDCGVPREFCDGWRQYDKHWSPTDRPCQYGTVLYDTVIGLFHCGDDRYQLDALEDMVEHDILDPDLEETASWFGRGAYC